MGANLPALQVVVPLVAAPLCVLLHRPALVWAFATVVCWAVFAIAVALLVQVGASGTIVYELGGWAVPWGIEYRVDSINVFVLLIVSGIAALVLPYARVSVDAEIPRDKQAMFYAMMLLTITGLLGITITGDAFNVFVFLEISSLSSYALISMGRDRRALTAAYQYLVMGTIGATFILIGIGFLYMVTGTLNMLDLAERIAPQTGSGTVQAAFAFLTVGIGLKLAMFPLHLWLPNAYSYAPSAVTVLLAATATKVAVYMFLRFAFTIFGASFAFADMQVGYVLMPLALIAMFVASTVAIFQNDVKRMFAYSSVAQVGYMMLGISFATTLGLTGGIVHMFNHALMKATMFMCLGAVFVHYGSVHIDTLQGLGRKMPLTFAALVVAGLSMIGVPGTVGFISKVYLVRAALDIGWWPVAVLILLSSLLAI
ncbi:MAG: monovalent cation/H+ antiporter subunit D family protein, partial [Proteobacteria bacterium]|nr:monovalent cation/H+ antiporter subunit D family protein [Pseudomonadota bacterium]